MRIALAQQNYHIGNFEANTQKIIAAVEAARQQKVDLIVFSELSICGYPPRDFLEFNDFINKCYQAIDVIKEHSEGIGILVGGPARNPQKLGKDLFNAAFLLYNKQIVAKYIKPCYPRTMYLMNTAILNLH